MFHHQATAVKKQTVLGVVMPDPCSIDAQPNVQTPGDVTFLCLNGIIATLSQDDIHVANLFSSLAKSVAFNAHLCYLSRQFMDLEAYGNSNWATMRRTYFSSPWSFISVSSAAFVIALTLIQTVMALSSYLKGIPAR
ncbi:hypothetical protein Vadar_025278 [Vaccinium darrowii]|uniref:Uncharacterized protein n=1 Tax=Vaccinium darrowii TaxID=229202 RepID=A0ACB7Y1H0_9ERIC|nr:hypothetical protein Vadar_025278 [Vaccinium darrowii]